VAAWVVCFNGASTTSAVSPVIRKAQAETTHAPLIKPARPGTLLTQDSHRATDRAGNLSSLFASLAPWLADQITQNAAPPRNSASYSSGLARLQAGKSHGNLYEGYAQF
jgi:hypothetical protein